MKGIGREKDGLYLLVHKASTRTGDNEHLAVQGHTAQATNEDLLLWHKRLAHASGGSMRELLGYKLEYCKSIVENCDVCPFLDM